MQIDYIKIESLSSVYHRNAIITKFYTIFINYLIVIIRNFYACHKSIKIDHLTCYVCPLINIKKKLLNKILQRCVKVQSKSLRNYGVR